MAVDSVDVVFHVCIGLVGPDNEVKSSFTTKCNLIMHFQKI